MKKGKKRKGGGGGKKGKILSRKKRGIQGAVVAALGRVLAGLAMTALRFAPRLIALSVRSARLARIARGFKVAKMLRAAKAAKELSKQAARVAGRVAKGSARAASRSVKNIASRSKSVRKRIEKFIKNFSRAKAGDKIGKRAQKKIEDTVEEHIDELLSIVEAERAILQAAMVQNQQPPPKHKYTAFLEAEKKKVQTRKKRFFRPGVRVLHTKLATDQHQQQQQPPQKRRTVAAKLHRKQYGFADVPQKEANILMRRKPKPKAHGSRKFLHF